MFECAPILSTDADDAMHRNRLSSVASCRPWPQRKRPLLQVPDRNGLAIAMRPGYQGVGVLAAVDRTLGRRLGIRLHVLHTA
jgi:hypothetical protein